MISENILRIREYLSCLCYKINKDPREISIVAVSKGISPEQIKEAVAAGIIDIGENRVQEAFVKYSALRTKSQELSAIRWHLVGHLQTNKAKDAVKIFDLIHSVDSIRLAEEINKQSERISKIQDILIQINTSEETSKFGLKTQEAIAVIKEIDKLKNVKIKGLMTIAPIVDNPENTRPYFKTLRELRDKINQLSAIRYPLSALSMGMSDDFRVAIEEGSNMIRLGRAIFEDTD